MITSLDDVRKELEELTKAADPETGSGDDESLHSWEDGLREMVLEAIAEGRLSGADAQEGARLALSTKDLVFHRWCA